MEPTSSTTDLRRCGALVAALLLLFAAAEPAGALKFESRQHEDGRRILLVRDCGLFEPRSECEEWERAFRVAATYPRLTRGSYRYPGDAAVLNAMVLDARQRGRPYDEVWLYSGGGHLDAGIELGRVLRRHGMTVRVPRGARCVSSCTVAFMGGLFRFVDEGATYEVHAGSWVSQALGSRNEALIARGDFAQIAEFYRVDARKTACQLLTHFQNTLIIPLNERPRAEDDAAFDRCARSSPPRAFYTEAQAALDRQRIGNEGLAAAQDILMRIEREAMAAAIADLEAMVRANMLGPRAGPALRMVQAMYDVSIQETAVLTRETMLRMGYITQEVPLQRRN
jgi:hypothetical protein